MNVLMRLFDRSSQLDQCSHNLPVPLLGRESLLVENHSSPRARTFRFSHRSTRFFCRHSILVTYRLALGTPWPLTFTLRISTRWTPFTNSARSFHPSPFSPSLILPLRTSLISLPKLFTPAHPAAFLFTISPPRPFITPFALSLPTHKRSPFIEGMRMSLRISAKTPRIRLHAPKSFPTPSIICSV
jgi:hypothetical protein